MLKKSIIAEWMINTLSDSEGSTESDSDMEEDEMFISGGNGERLAKIECYIEHTVAGYNDAVFRSHFRMSTQLAYILIERLQMSNLVPTHKHGKEKITAEKCMLLVLWYLANTETFRQISDRFDVSYSSAYRVLVRVLNFILMLRTEFIKWPNREQQQGISQEFRKKKGIENICGAIDGCHVKIRAPLKNEEDYVNRKGYHSILLQGTVDHGKMFIDVYCGEPGSIHDARLLRKSALYFHAHEDPNHFGDFFLLGDSAYPSLNWLVPPFKDNGALTANQKRFNFKHSSSRIIVEHTFGLLKGRFRRLQHVDNLDIKICVKIVMSACVLHNICQLHNDSTHIEPYNVQDQIDDSPELLAEYISCNNNNRREEVFQKMFY